jgi:hypothetical protein
MTSSSWADLIKDASASGASFDPLPDGVYDLKVVEASTATTAKGKTMYKVKAEVQTGPHARRLLWDNLVVSPESPNAMAFFFRKLKAIGLGHEFFSTEPTDAAIVAALSGRVFRGKVGSRTYNDKTSNEIQEYLPATQGGLPAGAVAPGAPAPAAAAPVAAPPAAAPAPAPAPQGFPQAPAAAPAPAPAAPAPASPWDNTPTAPQAPDAGGFAAPATPF